MKILKILSITLSLLGFYGCAHRDYSADNFKNFTAQELLQQGKTNVAKKNYAEAAKYLEAIDALYPFAAEAKRGQLITIYAYHMLGDADSALAAATRYIHLYPEDSQTDYAYYMKGIVYFNKNRTTMQKLLSKNLANLDVSDLNSAFVNFSELLRKFPQSSYAKDTEKRMLYIRNLIAEHELNIAKFYLERKAYLAAANRATDVIKHFAKTPQTEEALKIMIKSYDALGLEQQKKDAIKTFQHNFPKNF